MVGNQRDLFYAGYCDTAILELTRGRQEELLELLSRVASYRLVGYEPPRRSEPATNESAKDSVPVFCRVKGMSMVAKPAFAISQTA
jgi:hypothetical protein